MSPPVAIAHVNLRVSDLGRALEFYVGGLGYGVTGRLGDELAFRARRSATSR